MKEYHVEYSQKQITKLNRQIQQLLFAWIDKNLKGVSDPRIHSKGLTGNHAREWRYRIGDYRLICDIQVTEDPCIIKNKPPLEVVYFYSNLVSFSKSINL